MDKKLVENIRRNMESKSTADLEQILDKNNKNKYSDEAFEAIRQVLEDREKNPPSQQVQSQDINESNNQTAKGETLTDYTTTYGTARIIAQFVSFVGWAVVAISIVILLVFVMKGSSDSFVLMTGTFSSLAGVISGLILVMVGQMTRATVDTADNAGRMLAIMKKKWK